MSTYRDDREAALVQADALRKQNQSLRVENEALRRENDALRRGVGVAPRRNQGRALVFFVVIAVMVVSGATWAFMLFDGGRSEPMPGPNGPVMVPVSVPQPAPLPPS